VFVIMLWAAPAEEQAVILGTVFSTLVPAGPPAWTDGGAIHVPAAQEPPDA
jgi:hypothetical protein